MDKKLLGNLLIKRGEIFIGEKGTFDENISHSKFFVIMGEDEDSYIGFFFINSEVHKYIQARPELYSLQYPLSPEKYSFLSHDSVIGCESIKRLKKQSVLDGLEQGSIVHKGTLLSSDIDVILNMVSKSKVFTKHEKDTYFK